MREGSGATLVVASDPPEGCRRPRRAVSARRVRRPKIAGRCIEGWWPLVGSTLGPYCIDAELGSGGMGRVYAATGPSGVVALKVIHPHLVADGDALARFRREAQVGVSIRHRNVVATLAAGEERGENGVQHWLALEYVEGQTLHSLQEELGTVPEELCRHVAHEVAAGLAAIHAAGIVHRDMKPENVLITRDHVVKVMDLGVARGAEDDSRLTQTGAFVGSLQYAAPEQFTGGGKGLDGRADLHALGVLLYELSTGTNPYEDTDWRVVFQKVMKETPRRLGAVNPQVSPFFEEVVHTLLAKDRDQRFASAAELVSVLEAGEDSPWWTAKARSIRGATKRPLRRIKIPRETALIGRDIEMTKLRAVFEKAKVGDGQVVLVEGEAGIGKSRLVDEFVALLQREGEDLDFLYGSYPPGGAATASGAFSTAYREHFGGEGLAETLGGYLKQTPLLVPGFAALLTSQAPPEGALALTKDSLQTCFVHATRAIAAERIAVVLIDDLHFAPEEGKALFASLAMAVPGHRILLVGTSRPPLDETWAANLVRLGHATRMGVGRLGAKDLVALLKDALKSSHLAEELSLKIASSTDGNPFFVFEVLRGLKDGEYLTQRPDGTWATTKVIREIQIPSSIADMIQARVGDIDEEGRSLLEIAACAGFEFDAGLVGDVAGLGRIPLLKALGTIERAHRLIRAAGRRYVFDHHQVQEHLYGGLSEFAREGYHAAIAESLERTSGAASKDPGTLDGALCVDLCEHFLKGAQGGRAARYLATAHAHLGKNYRNAEAATLAERALAVPGLLAGAERARTLLRLCGVLGLLGQRARQEQAAREAERLAESVCDDELRAQAANALAWCLYQTARPAEAESGYRRARQIALTRGDRKTEAGAETDLGSVFWSQGRLGEAREHHERALAIQREIGNRHGEAVAAGNLGSDFYSQGRLGEAREHFERHRAISREIGDPQGEAIATGNLGLVFQSEGCLGEAREHQERALAIHREIGNRTGEARAIGNLGSVLRSQGHLALAREHQERALAIHREIGNRRSEAIALQNLGSIILDGGDPASAEQRFLAALAIGEEIGHRHIVAASQMVLGNLHLESGEESRARDWLTKARDESSRHGAIGVETVSRSQLACLTGGDAEDAERCFTAHEERLSAEERLGARWFLWRATGSRTHLAEAKRLLDESLAKVPAEHHTAMLANVRVNREVTAAAKEQGL